MARARSYAYGKKYKGCPCCITKENAQRYFAYCTSEKNPKYHGVPVEIKDTDKGAICIGRKLDGKSYTACPYYIRGGGSKGAKAEKPQGSQGTARRKRNEEDMAVGMKLVKILVAVGILLFVLKMIL